MATRVSDTGAGNGTGRRIKVVRVIEEYGLDDVGDRMVRRWTASGDERLSLRALAEEFNRTLVRTAMVEAGMQPLDGEAANAYRLLTADEVGEADRIRTRRRLDREGVDVDRLERDFVTYQAIRTYLKEYRGATYSDEGGEGTASERETLQELRGRVLSVANSTLDRLAASGDLDLGEFRTLVDVNVLCEDCGAQYSVDDLIDRGGCDCAASQSRD